MANSATAMRSAIQDCRGDLLASAFVTAVLLTGSASLAEAAVLEAIQEAGSGEPLLGGTVNVSLRISNPVRSMSSNEADSALSAVPAGLRDVLALHHLPRQCFVLRMLLALPSRQCEYLLNISEFEVASYSGTAASSLARIEIRKKLFQH